MNVRFQSHDFPLSVGLSVMLRTDGKENTQTLWHYISWLDRNKSSVLAISKRKRRQKINSVMEKDEHQYTTIESCLSREEGRGRIGKKEENETCFTDYLWVCMWSLILFLSFVLLSHRLSRSPKTTCNVKKGEEREIRENGSNFHRLASWLLSPFPSHLHLLSSLVFSPISWPSLASYLLLSATSLSPILDIRETWKRGIFMYDNHRHFAGKEVGEKEILDDLRMKAKQSNEAVGLESRRQSLKLISAAVVEFFLLSLSSVCMFGIGKHSGRFVSFAPQDITTSFPWREMKKKTWGLLQLYESFLVARKVWRFPLFPEERWRKRRGRESPFHIIPDCSLRFLQYPFSELNYLSSYREWHRRKARFS